ncbi:hypothetical protein M0Q97_06275 [Candidatus Dojkabacteria bacterium]|jgi:hypothetical protein|nr:hypothetical protein [Candidatus Dojkabacteria bacterium]
MKKVLIILFIILSTVRLSSQNSGSNNAIIGVGQSDNYNIFYDIQEYLTFYSKDLKILFTCEQHNIIMIDNHKIKLVVK